MTFAEALPDSLEGQIVIVNGATMHMADPLGIIRDIIARRPKALMLGNNFCQPPETIQRFGIDLLVVDFWQGDLFAPNPPSGTQSALNTLARAEVFSETARDDFRYMIRETREQNRKLFHHPESEFLVLGNMDIVDFFFFT